MSNALYTTEAIEFIASIPQNKTPIPNEFFDVILGTATSPEVQVLSCLFRHAWRNHASTAVVTYRQFIDGTRDGDRIIDRGCAVKTSATLVTALARLENQGYITRHPGRYLDGGAAPTLYELHVGIYGNLLPARFDIDAAGTAPPRTRNVRFTGKRAWEAVKRAYGYRCADCGRREPNIELTRDHIIPTSRGGLNTADNIAPRCRSCNARKGNHLMDGQQ